MKKSWVKKLISIVLCVLLLTSMLGIFCFADSSNLITSISTSGFTIGNFDSQKDYYLIYPQSFSNLKITKIALKSQSAAATVKVEQYCGKTYTYTVGNTLDLGYGRAKITINVTDGTLNKEYLLCLTDPNQKNYSYCYVQNSATKIKKAASSTSETLTTLPSNSWLYYLNETINGYRKIQLCSGAYIGQIGYISKNDCFVGFGEITMPNTFESAINKLKKAHPKWTFKFVNMGTTIEEYSAKVKKAVISNYDGTNDTSLTKIKYYMNPLNFLNEKDIFMFLNVKNIDGEFTKAGIKGVWVEKTNGLTDAVASNYFMKAYKSVSINPYFATARAGLESGWGTSKLSTGSVSGYSGYYNFYGIGAVDDNPLIGGASYAKNRNWNSKERSIIEGANWLKDQYVDRLQNSIYFFRFFPVAGRDWHVYMSDIAAPKSEAQNLYKAYNASGKIDTSIEFIIPVYADLISKYSVIPTSNVVNIREKASLSANILTTAKFSQELLYLGVKEKGFYKVLLTDSENMGKIGYISAEYSKVFDFDDISKSAWYREYVIYAYITDLMNGTENHKFAPNQKITRGEIVTILGRMAGINPDKYQTNQFTDLTKNYYKGYVAWAYKAGITNGTSKTKFSPDQPVTRQDFCALVLRFAKYKKVAIPSGKTLSFADKNSVSSYAIEAVAVCAYWKIVSGKGNNIFAPKDTTLRSEGAKMLSILHKDVLNIRG